MGWKDWIKPIGSVLGGTDVGSFLDSTFNAPSGNKEYKRQKEFAQNAIQWRVADATGAGLHPLAALGMPVASYSPEVVGGGSSGSFEGMGQNLARAMGAYGDPAGKVSAQYQALQIENASLQNDKLRAEIALMNQPGSPPGIVQTPQGAWAVSPEAPKAYSTASKAYGDETAEWGVGMPWMAYDLLRQPGNILDPGNVVSAKAGAADAQAAVNAAIATLKQWYRPGGWNQYWR